MKQLGKLIRTLRQEWGYTQTQLAKRLGIEQGTLSKLEAGIFLPGLLVMLRLERIACKREDGSWERLADVLARLR